MAYSEVSNFIEKGEIRAKYSVEENNNYVDILPLGYSVSSFVNIYSARRGERLFFLKTLKNTYKEDIIYVNILKKEYEIGVRLEHPDICRTISFEQIPELGPTIVMEYINGVTLREYISKKILTTSLFKKITNEILDAFEYMHRCGYYHKDIKPENILITNNGNNVKIIDFGLSHGDVYRRQLIDGGTSSYIKDGNNTQINDNAERDIFAIGVVISQMLDSLCSSPGSRYVRLADIASLRRKGRRFLSVNEMRNFVLGKRDNFIWISVTGAFLIILISVFAIFYRDVFLRHNVEDSIEYIEEGEINTTHFKCYHLIDSVINSEYTKLSAVYKEYALRGNQYNLAEDSLRISDVLSTLIKKEYGSNVNSLEAEQSLKWGSSEFLSMLKQVREF